jgi:GT2 family glycosyltransferase
MDVSIVIINYNTFDLTCQCIQSIIEKTSGLTYEIIVVDNASTERDPVDFLAAFSDIILIQSQENGGFANGNNKGIKNASGDYVLLLNSDTRLLNNAIEICFRSIRSDSKIGVIGGALFFPDGARQHNCQRFPSIFLRLFEIFRLQKMLPKSVGDKILLGFFFDHKEPTDADWIWGTFFMFRRDRLDDFPGRRLPEDFFMYGEDMKWCMEFKKRNLRIAFEPAARIEHLMGKSGAAKSDMMKKNGVTFMRLYYNPVERMVIKILDRIIGYE